MWKHTPPEARCTTRRGRRQERRRQRQLVTHGRGLRPDLRKGTDAPADGRPGYQCRRRSASLQGLIGPRAWPGRPPPRNVRRPRRHGGTHARRFDRVDQADHARLSGHDPELPRGVPVSTQEPYPDPSGSPPGARRMRVRANGATQPQRVLLHGGATADDPLAGRPYRRGRATRTSRPGAAGPPRAPRGSHRGARPPWPGRSERASGCLPRPGARERAAAAEIAGTAGVGLAWLVLCGVAVAAPGQEPVEGALELRHALAVLGELLVHAVEPAACCRFVSIRPSVAPRSWHRPRPRRSPSPRWFRRSRSACAQGCCCAAAARCGRDRPGGSTSA